MAVTCAPGVSGTISTTWAACRASKKHAVSEYDSLQGQALILGILSNKGSFTVDPMFVGLIQQILEVKDL